MQRILLAMFLAWAVHAGPAVAASDGVEVILRLLTPDALEVSYALPPACAAIPFIKNGAAGREVRAGWQAQGDCGSAGGDRLERGQGSCQLLRFRVPAAGEQPGYPAAFPVGQGLYAHLSNYAVDDSCGKVHYALVAPWVALDGRVFPGAATLDDGDTAALLLKQKPAQQALGAPAWFDPRLSPAAVAQILAVADGTVAWLRRALPQADYKAPILAAALVDSPGAARAGGDASDVLRLALYNWPRDPGPQELARLTLVVAHEYSHRFQLRDAVDVYPDARLIHEGGGEFLRWLVSVREGWLTPAAAAADLDHALADCMLDTDGQRWRTVPARAIALHRLAYTCGLPAYVYALAARQGRGSATARIDDFYAALKRGPRPDFAQALECGVGTPAAACGARWLPALLDGAAPMESAWAEMFARTGLAHPQPPNQDQRDAMLTHAVEQLMKDDCGGRLDAMPVPGGMLLGGMKACKTFRQDAEVTAVEGLPFAGHPDTGAAMAAACATRHEVALGLKGGASLTVPCAAPYPMRTAFYHADIDKLLAALARE